MFRFIPLTLDLLEIGVDGHSSPDYLVSFFQRLFRVFFNLSTSTYNKLERTIPGFSQVMEKVQVDAAAREARRERRREADKRAEEKARFGDVPIP